MTFARAYLLVLLLVVTGTSVHAAERTRLLIWGVTLNPNDRGLSDMIGEFERRNPDIEVRLLGMGAGGMNPQKLMTAIVGGVPPDVVYQDRFTISDWAARGAFRPLDDLITRDRGRDPLTPLPEQYYEAPWAEVTYDGQVYGVPATADTRALHWNRTIFREDADKLRAAGLDPERPPRTWSETLAYSRVLTQFNADGSLKRAGFIPNFGNSWLYLYAFQNNARFMSADGRRCTLNTPEAVEALQFMIEGYRILGGIDNAEKFRATFRGEQDSPFFVGQIAMVIDGDWSLSGIALYAPTLDFGTAPPPVPDDRFLRRGRFEGEKDTFVTWSGGFSWVIPRGAKNEEAAWRFIKWVTSFEGRQLRSGAQRRFDSERGRPSVPSVNPQIRQNEAQLRGLPSHGNLADGIRTHIELMEVARWRPATFAGQTLWDMHVRAIDTALRGADPATALQEGQDRVQFVLDEVFNRARYPVVDLRAPTYLGGAIALASLVGFAWWVRSRRLGRLAAHEAKWAYLFVAPWVFGFLVFTIGPMVASLFFSFTQYNVLQEARWVGVKNYSDLFGLDRDLVTQAFANVAYMAGIGVPLGIVSGLAVALLLNAGVRGQYVYRTVFYLPSVFPLVATVLLWMWILNPDPNRGLLNAMWATTIGDWFGTRPPGWFTVEAWAKPALIVMGLWGVGSGMILWLAGLKGVPNTLYEAASIDGASPWRQFWSVTVPQLSPLIFFTVVMGFIGSLQTFDAVYVVTNGSNYGPNDSLLMPVNLLFASAFSYFRMGYASALAWVIFVIVLLVTLVQFWLAPRWVHYEVER